jgi:hypothetical protein
VGTVFKTLYPKVVENEIEKVRKKDTFPTIRCNRGSPFFFIEEWWIGTPKEREVDQRLEVCEWEG